MENKYFKHKSFNFLFQFGRNYVHLGNRDYLLGNEQYHFMVKSILDKNDFWIEITPPQINYQVFSQLGSGWFINPKKVQLYFQKHKFDNEIDFFKIVLQNKNNPLFIIDDQNMEIYRPFCFKGIDDYKSSILTYSDISVSNDVNDLNFSPLINLKISSGNIDTTEFEEFVYIFALPYHNKLVVFDIRNVIPIISEGNHVVPNNFIDLKHSLNGCFLNYSFIHEDKWGNKFVKYGKYDLYKSEVVSYSTKKNESPDHYFRNF
jgi:hypothetical protein